MKTVILGTAGHIDHGKTALVQALTGVDTDRLPEEKERGITIDLGFANMQIGEHHFAIIDVPGHEAFIRNMLAGATGIDVVLLVVAADEGVMPQTLEHIAILDLLNVQTGVVAITKNDLASEEWLQLVVDDVRQALAKTTLATSSIIPVSSRTGQGIDALKDALVRYAQHGERDAGGLFRMPIDRVFTVRGTGTVVTGTIWSGLVHTDDEIVLMPSGLTARVRGLQTHGAAVEKAGAGERAALALASVERGAIRRGETAIKSAFWKETGMLTIRARGIHPDWRIRQRQRVRVHIGTTEALARAFLLDRDVIGNGEEGWVQLRLEQPVMARVGDRLVLRSYSPVTTIGGGVVAELSTSKRGALSPKEDLLLAQALEGSAAAVLTLRAAAGAHVEELPILGVKSELPRDATRIGSRIYSNDVVQKTIAVLLKRVDDLHAQNPLRPALDLAEVKAQLHGDAELLTYCIKAAAEENAIVLSGSAVKRTGFTPKLNVRQTALLQTLREALSAAGLAPPSLEELSRAYGDVLALLRLLEGEGAVRSISPDFFVAAAALDSAAERIRQELGGCTGLGASDFRPALPVSRKHLIPLLEYFDRIGVTQRIGDLRSVPAGSGSGLRGAV